MDYTATPCHICTPEDKKNKKYLCDLLDTRDGLPVRCAHVHTRLKIHMLKYYLEIFSLAMKNKFTQRNFLDLFAGPGLCYDRDSQEFFDGSSLVAVKLDQPFNNYLFVDKDKSTSSILSKRCKSVRHNAARNVKMLNYDSNRQIDEILTNVKTHNSISVALADPNGLDIHFDTVRKLSSLRHMDVIINFSVSDLKRNFPLYRHSNPKADLFFGTKNWPDNELEWVPFYKERLSRLGYVGIEGKDEGSVSIDAPNGAKIYFLIFASKHRLGLDFWREAKKKYLNLNLFSS